ncbi:Tapt1 family [Trinorchestia longiramus]|nr:Tapt1 family [Trinorchestia longiramus]
MVLVAMQTLKEYNWSEERLYILLPDCMLVLGTEVLVDWIKHAFMTRCNDIPIDAYREYTTILAHDLVMCKQKYVSVWRGSQVAGKTCKMQYV